MWAHQERILAGLELAKRRQVAMRQREPFTDLWLYLREEEDEISGRVKKILNDALSLVAFGAGAVALPSNVNVTLRPLGFGSTNTAAPPIRSSGLPRRIPLEPAPGSALRPCRRRSRCAAPPRGAHRCGQARRR